MSSPKLYIRQMTRSDLPEIIEIENHSFGHPWNEEDFIRCRRCEGHSVVVAEFDECVAGFMFYKLEERGFSILNFAVHEAYRRKGIGVQLSLVLLNAIEKEVRTKIELIVSEENFEAQQFFSSLGFKAVSILKSYYDDLDSDAYVFEYRLGAKKKQELVDRFGKRAKP